MVSLLLHELESICKQIDNPKDNDSKMQNYEDVKQSLILTKEKLLKVIFQLNNKEKPTVSDYTLSLYNFFDNVDERNMICNTYDIKNIIDKHIYIHPYLHSVDKSHVDKYITLPICNIELQKYPDIHRFLVDIGYEPYHEYCKTYEERNIGLRYAKYNQLTYTINNYDSIYSFIGMNLPDPHDKYFIKTLTNDNTPCRYLSIYLMYQSLIKRKNIIKMTQKINNAFSFEFEDNKTKYLYIVNNIELKVLPEGYKHINIRGLHSYFIYSREFY